MRCRYLFLSAGKSERQPNFGGGQPNFGNNAQPNFGSGQPNFGNAQSPFPAQSVNRGTNSSQQTNSANRGNPMQTGSNGTQPNRVQGGVSLEMLSSLGGVQDDDDDWD